MSKPIRHNCKLRQKLLSALFAKAGKMGISQEDLRDVIAPNVIKKRLSVASPQEIMRLLDHIAGHVGARRAVPLQYESSMSGLIKELEDISRKRWGADFERSLNRFINVNRKSPTHYRFLKVADLKAIKTRLKHLNLIDGINNG